MKIKSPSSWQTTVILVTFIVCCYKGCVNQQEIDKATEIEHVKAGHCLSGGFSNQWQPCVPAKP